MVNALSVRSKSKKLLRVLSSDDIVIQGYDNDKSIKVVGIWDTGATGSVITKRVIQELGLSPTGVVKVHTANGEVLKNTYDIKIQLMGRVLVKGIVATEADALTGQCDALIGMDIIGLGDFSITNFEGTTVMSFRIPSQKEVDFVKQISNSNSVIERHKKSGLSSNSKCSCGSGKKFKNCHGKNLQ